MVKKTIRTYLGLLLGFELTHSLMFGTYVLFLAENGMDLLQVGLINLAFMISIFIFEIPTGAVADIFGRKNSFVIGCLIYAAGFIAYFFSHSFWGFVLAEVILAIGASLVSGAFDAWMVDSVHYYGFNGDLKKIFGKKQWVVRIAQIPGAIFGAWLGKFSLSLPWLFSGLGLAVVGVIAFGIMKEEYHIKTKRSWQQSFTSIKEIATDSITYGLKNKNILYLMILGFGIAISTQALNMYWSIRFEDLLGHKEYMGYIWAGIVCTTVIGITIASWLLPKFIKKTSISMLISYLITAIMILVASLSSQTAIILTFFFLHEVGRGMIMPITDSFLHSHIPGDKRATVSSFKSMITKGGAAAGLLTMGLISKNFGIPTAWLVSAILLFSFAPVALMLKDD